MYLYGYSYMKFHGALYCITRVRNCHLKANMLSGAFTVFHIKREGAPSGVKHTQRGQKSPVSLRSILHVTPSLPPLPSLLSLFSALLFVSLSCIHHLFPFPHGSLLCYLSVFLSALTILAVI